MKTKKQRVHSEDVADVIVPQPIGISTGRSNLKQRKKKKVKVYALSTCGWCRKTVNWLKENGIKAEVIYTGTCEVCGAEYTSRSSRARYCGGTCGMRAHRARKKAAAT